MVLALLTLGVGYLVFAAAAKESDKALRLFGLVIALVVLIGSASTIVCKAGCKTGLCPTSKSMCPFTVKKDKAHHHEAK
jgi:hypothetical protein